MSQFCSLVQVMLSHFLPHSQSCCVIQELSVFCLVSVKHPDADKSLAQPTPRCILFDGDNIWFDASLVKYINSTYIPPIMIINRIYEHQNLLSLYLVFFLVRLRTYQHPCIMQCFSLCRTQT